MPVTISVSMPRSCRIACRSDEPGANAPKRRFGTRRSCGSTSSPGQIAWPNAPGLNVSIMRCRRSGAAEVLEEGGPGGDGDRIEGVLDIDHQAAGGAQGGADPVDVRHDLACRGDLGDLAWGHEAVLQIDHDVGGSLWDQAVEYPKPAATLMGTADDIGMDGRLVHGRLLCSCCQHGAAQHPSHSDAIKCKRLRIERKIGWTAPPTAVMMGKYCCNAA